MKWFCLMMMTGLMLSALLGLPQVAQADVSDLAIRKLVSNLLRTSGREAAELGAETLTKRVGALCAKHGDTALQAFRRVGPRASGLVENAVDPSLAVRLLASRGDDAVRIVSHPRQLALAGRLGEDGVESLIRHGESVVDVLDACGPSAASALKGLSSQSARKTAILFADGELTKLGKADEILAVIGKYGDAGAAWIWSNKGALTLGTALTAFLLEPGVFIDGGKDLAGIAADSVVKPVVTSAANTFPWVLLTLLIGAASCVAVWIWRVPRTAMSLVWRVLAKGAGRLWTSK